jgi:hypothetical protein
MGKQVNFPGLMLAELWAASAGFFLFIISANKRYGATRVFRVP